MGFLLFEIADDDDVDVDSDDECMIGDENEEVASKLALVSHNEDSAVDVVAASLKKHMEEEEEEEDLAAAESLEGGLLMLQMSLLLRSRFDLDLDLDLDLVTCDAGPAANVGGVADPNVAKELLCG